MSISVISKEQWVSVVKNAVFAGVAAFAVAFQASGEVSKTAFYSAVVAGVTAVIKIVEKTFSEA